MTRLAALRLRRPGAVLLAGLLAQLAACYVPAPAAHAQLQLGSDGSCALDGQAVAVAELPARLRERRAGAATLVVEIHAAPAVPVAAIDAAVHAISEAHATVAFAVAASAP